MTDHISDLVDTVIAWVWKYNIVGLWRKQDVDITVSFQDVNFHYEKPVFTNQRRSALPTSSLLMTSNYNNRTAFPQQVEIKVKRRTSAKAEIRMRHGLTAESRVSIKMGVPDEVVGTFGSGVPVEMGEENNFEKGMTWSFHSKITAAPWKTTVAKFEVQEAHVSCDFSTFVSFSGSARIEAVHKHTGEVIDVKEDILTILDRLLPDADETSPKKNLIYINNGNVRWPCRGEIDLQYGVSQTQSVE